MSRAPEFPPALAYNSLLRIKGATGTTCRHCRPAEAAFEAFKESVSDADRVATAQEAMKCMNVPAEIQKETISNLNKFLPLTDSGKQLMFNYKLAFESQKSAGWPVRPGLETFRMQVNVVQQSLGEAIMAGILTSMMGPAITASKTTCV